MPKTFEDEFTALQKDMIDICLEYVEDRVEKVFINTEHWGRLFGSQFFYQHNGRIVRKHLLNTVLKPGEKPFDLSMEPTKKVLSILIEDMKKISKVCEKYGHPCPEQIFLEYEVATHRARARYQYDYSAHMDEEDEEPWEKWFDEEKAKLGQA